MKTIFDLSLEITYEGFLIFPTRVQVVGVDAEPRALTEGDWQAFEAAWREQVARRPIFPFGEHCYISLEKSNVIGNTVIRDLENPDEL